MMAPALFRRASLYTLMSFALLLVSAEYGHTQGRDHERTFAQSKATVEKALQQMQESLAGRLPALEGFAIAADHPLNRYQRAYYQSTIQVSPAPSGGALVRVTAKVTAWYSDAVASRSGYQLLTSNGRLETDLLDQLGDELAKGTSSASAVAKTSPSPTASKADSSEPIISEPVPRLPDIGGTFSSSLAQNLSALRPTDSPGSSKTDKESSALQAEADSLQEVLKSQSHPKNLVAVKKSGTSVVANPSLNAKPQFLASAHDEFEMLDFNANWVHVRISGLSRGWIWRNSLEMSESIPNTEPTGPAPTPGAELFHVSREESAQFPGDWEPLRGKSVKIISIEKNDESLKEGSPQLKREFAKSLLDKSSTELAQKPQDVAGIVLIFDSADGGMIAATLPTLQQWKAGKLSDAALWHQCFFDPPEILNSTSESSASQ